MSSEQTRWELRRGAEVLGRLVAYAWDYPWLDCDFEPTPAFAEYRTVFDDDLSLLSAPDSDPDAWEAAYDKIAGLGLVFVPVDARAEQLRADLLDAEDDRPWLRRLLGL